jgi:hypothetical protein
MGININLPNPERPFTFNDTFYTLWFVERLTDILLSNTFHRTSFLRNEISPRRERVNLNEIS